MSDTPTPRPAGARGRIRVMIGRDPHEHHRVATPLELLFDLCFVVAISQAALGLHHHLAEGHIAEGLGSYASVFFAIWWAWVNFTWFASAYDTDDVPYRLLTLLQILGVIVLAAGVDNAFAGDFAIITVGYLVMRVGLIAQWIRASLADHAHAATARRYAVGLAVLQVGWICRLWLPDSLLTVSFIVLVVAELAVPTWAERSNHGSTNTPWHPHHIAERYGLLTIIVLGECILSSFAAVNGAITDHGVSIELITISVCGLVILFGLWWLYFRIPGGDMLHDRPTLAFFWGYVHYFVFAAIAAFGAGVAVAVEWSLDHHPAESAGHAAQESQFALSDTATTSSVAIPVAIALAMIAFICAVGRTESVSRGVLAHAVAVLVVVAGALGGLVGVKVTMIVVAAVVTAYVARVVVGDRARRPAQLTSTSAGSG